MLPSFPRSAKAESKIDSGIFTNILHTNWYNGKKKNESIFELTCKCNVYYLHNNRLPYGNRFLYFQLEVEYYFNKTNKNK